MDHGKYIFMTNLQQMPRVVTVMNHSETKQINYHQDHIGE